jgi:hypothetical protein
MRFPPAPPGRAAGLPVEADRTANKTGVVSVAGRSIPIGDQHAGCRVSPPPDCPLPREIVDGVPGRPVAFDQRMRPSRSF